MALKYCDKCAGGWVITDAGCVRCECVEKEMARTLIEKAGVKGFERLTFDTYQAHDVLSNGMKEKAMEYAKDHEGKSVMLLGSVGSGKTHLSIAIANELLSRGVNVVYMPYRDEITRIKQNMMDEAVYARSLAKFQRAKVLVIDDLYKGKITDSDINIMFEIINHRYFNKLSTIVSSEKIYKELEEIDAAIASRLYEMSKGYTLNIEGQNYRTRNIKRG